MADLGHDVTRMRILAKGLRKQLAKDFKQNKLCYHPATLLLQLYSYLQTLPQELRLPLSVQALSAAQSLFEVETLTTEKALRCN